MKVKEKIPFGNFIYMLVKLCKIQFKLLEDF